MYYPNITLDSL